MDRIFRTVVIKSQQRPIGLRSEHGMVKEEAITEYIWLE